MRGSAEGGWPSEQRHVDGRADGPKLTKHMRRAGEQQPRQRVGAERVAMPAAASRAPRRWSPSRRRRRWQGCRRAENPLAAEEAADRDREEVDSRAGSGPSRRARSARAAGRRRSARRAGSGISLKSAITASASRTASSSGLVPAGVGRSQIKAGTSAATAAPWMASWPVDVRTVSTPRAQAYTPQRRYIPPIDRVPGRLSAPRQAGIRSSSGSWALLCLAFPRGWRYAVCRKVLNATR